MEVHAARGCVKNGKPFFQPIAVPVVCNLKLVTTCACPLPWQLTRAVNSMISR